MASLKKLEHDNGQLKSERSKLSNKFQVLTSELTSLKTIAHAIRDKENHTQPASSMHQSMLEFPDFGGNNLSKIESVPNQTQKFCESQEMQEIKTKRSYQTSNNAQVSSLEQTNEKDEIFINQLNLLSDSKEKERL